MIREQKEIEEEISHLETLLFDYDGYPPSDHVKYVKNHLTASIKALKWVLGGSENITSLKRG